MRLAVPTPSAILGTDPNSADTDSDGLNDGAEIDAGTNPLAADSDADGIDDGAEVGLGTNPLAADSDGDGTSDGEEVTAGTDPLDPTDFPAPPVVEESQETVISETVDLTTLDDSESVVVERDDGSTTVTVPIAAVPGTTSIDVTVETLATSALAEDAAPPPDGTLLVGGQAFSVTIADDQGGAITKIGIAHE